MLFLLFFFWFLSIFIIGIWKVLFFRRVFKFLIVLICDKICCLFFLVFLILRRSLVKVDIWFLIDWGCLKIGLFVVFFEFD